MGHSLIQRINSSLEEWAEALEAELVLLRVYINVVFGGDRRESGFSFVLSGCGTAASGWLQIQTMAFETTESWEVFFCC